MEDKVVLDDVVELLLTLMKESFGDNFKAYYEGDPIIIPEANLPCVIVEKVAGRIQGSATGTDNFDSELRLRFVMNKQSDYGASDGVDLTERKLRRLVEARDATTAKYKEGTVLYILRTHIQLGGAVLDLQIDVNYDLQPRPRSLVTSEALISIVTKERVIRPPDQP